MREQTRARVAAFWTTLPILIIGSSCAESLESRKAAFAELRSISIDPNVAVTGRFTYLGPETMLIFTSTPYATVMIVPRQRTDENGKTVDEVLTTSVENGQVNVRDLLLKAFKEELSERGWFSDISTTGGDARFHLVIEEYMVVSPTHPFGAKLMPTITAKACLRRPDGSVLWQRKAETTFHAKEMTCYTGQDYANNPDLLLQSFAQAAEIVADDLVTNLARWRDK